VEPEHRPGGTRDFRRLAGLLEQPLAALAGPGCDKPVWHCSVRAAPADRMLSDAEWALVAERVMHRTGAPRALRNPHLRRAADSYDRAARAQYGGCPGAATTATSCAARPG